MLYCVQCGAEVATEDKFCPKCGHPNEALGPPASPGAGAGGGGFSPSVSAPSPLASTMPVPQSSTAPASPKKLSGCALAAITGGGVLVLLGLLVAGVISLAFVLSSGAVAAMEKHLALLKQGEVERAYEGTSSGFRSVTSLEDYRAFVNAYPALSRVKSSSFGERSVEDSIATLGGTILDPEGRKSSIRARLIKEGDEWKVMAVEVSGGRGEGGDPLSGVAEGTAVWSSPGKDTTSSVEGIGIRSGNISSVSPVSVPPSATSVGGKVTSSDGVEDAAVEAAMASADAFYYWYLNKWEEPDLEPEWFEKSEDLSPGFRRAWKELQDQSYRENEGVGLDYDPVVGSQNIPPGGFRAVHGEPAGQPGLVRVVMLGVGWDFFLDLLMRLDEASGNWQVDAIDNLNRGDVAFDPVEIPAERRAAVTLEVFLELMALGEPWQAYELTSTGFQRRADIDRFRAFPDRASFPPRRTPASRRLSGDGFRQVFAIEVGEGSEALLIDEAGESIWSVHHLRIGTHEIGVPPGPALDVKIGGAVMGTGRDPSGGQITGQDYVFDAAGREPVSVDIPLSNSFPGLSLELSVLSADFGQTLLETVVPVPADAGAETVVRWEMPRAGRSWQGGDYQLVIRVPDGPVRKEVFGLR